MKVVCTISEEDILLLNEFNIKLFDVIEIRLDLFSKEYIKNNLIEFLLKIKKQIIFTYRLPEDSSVDSFTKFRKEDIQELISSFNSTENFLDIELNRKNEIFNKNEFDKYKIIYSFHSFDGIISLGEMEEEIGKIQENDEKTFFKFAVKSDSYKEIAEFLKSIKLLAYKYKITGICMGEKGVISRIFGDYYGSFFTYCSVDKERAPGQISLETYHLFRT